MAETQKKSRKEKQEKTALMFLKIIYINQWVNRQVNLPIYK